MKEEDINGFVSRFVKPISQEGELSLNPREFSETAPIGLPPSTVVRPEVPDIEEELPAEARDGSILSGFVNLMDNVVPDDMGGAIRGETGWLSELPFYRETLGTALGVPLTGGAAVIDAVNWGSEQMNHLGAALFSAMPGGIQTLDWEQSQDISMGQVVSANAALNQRQGFGGWLINSATGGLLGLAADTGLRYGKEQDPENILYSEEFDILDEQDRKEAFESGGMGQLTSGFADAIWLVAADPTILGGKAVNVIRLGTKAGEFSGLSNQALKTAESIERFGSTVDDQAALLSRTISEAGGDTKAGVAAARRGGELTPEGENLIRAMDQSADQLQNHVWVKGSNNKTATQGLLGQIGFQSPEEAAALTGALAGRASSWAQLRTLNAGLYDDAARALGVDPLSSRAVGGTADDFGAGQVALTDEQISYGDDLVEEALTPYVGPDGFAQTIQRGGSRVAGTAAFTRAANAWRTGATQDQFVNNAFKKSSLSSNAESGHWVYDTIQRSSMSRPVTAVRWAGRGTPNGIVFVKDGADGASRLDEVRAWLTKSGLDQETSARYFNEFASSRTVNERTNILRLMEDEAIQVVTRKRGIGEAKAKELWNAFSKKRATVLQQISKSKTNFYRDPDTDELITVPTFYAELDQAVPLVDIKKFDSVVKDKAYLKIGREAKFAGDYLNSLWKVSVLIRLGYTQRNIAEGALRSFAVLGLMAANPQAWGRLPANAVHYARARKGLKGLRLEEKRLGGVYDNLINAQKTYDNAISNSGYRDIDGLQRKIVAAERTIGAIRGETGPFPGSVRGARAAGPQTTKTLSKKQQKKVDKLQAEIKKSKEQVRQLIKTKTEPGAASLKTALRERDKIVNDVNSIGAKVLAKQDEVNKIIAKRKLTGRGKRTYKTRSGKVDLDAAFDGQQGEIALLASSADKTTYFTFDAAVSKRIDDLEGSADFKRLDPNDLSSDKMPVYWTEYALRVNRRYREDPLGRRILANEPIANLKAWFKTDEGIEYKRQLSLRDRNLDSQQEIDEYIDRAIARLNYELPQGSKLRELALDGQVTPAQVMAGLEGRELPVLVGRLSDGLESTVLEMTARGTNKVTSRLMKFLGTVPENKLLRHPFYSSVFDAEQARIVRLLSAQGRSADEIMAQQANIAKSAHASALKSTRETMYTIDRLSNAGHLLRFVSPFFPAWENSVRTWGRIAYQNPAVIGYGSLMWNIPNRMGLVVDEFGEKVDRSSFLKDEGTYIMMPKFVQDWATKEYGPLPGQMLQTRQQSLNVVFPSSNWWFSGMGPAAQIPTGWFLRGKPEDTEVLRNALGEEMFRDIVPNANPQASLVESLMPTAGRRVKQWLGGESTDSAYLSTWNHIVEDEYIRIQLEGRSVTDRDMKKMAKKANDFWTFQLFAAVAAPFQFSRVSPYQAQRDYWQKLLDDGTMPLQQKYKAFSDKFPDVEYTALTRSTSDYETGLSPNLKTWQRVTGNKEVVDRLYAIEPELVGMFGNMGRFDDPFSYAVYGEFGKMKLGPNQVPVRRRLTPTEIVRNNEIKDGWAAYWEVKDYIEDQVILKGYKTLQSDAVKPFKDILDAEELRLAKQYPAWGEERDLYAQKLPAFIRGARVMAANPELMDEDSSIRALADYLEVREHISDVLSRTDNVDKREEVRQIGYKFAFDLRQQDIGFADLYDQYLSRDDFREVN